MTFKPSLSVKYDLRFLDSREIIVYNAGKNDSARRHYH